MQLSSRILTSSEILNLDTTPIEILPPQGNGFYIVPFSMLFRSRTGSKVYTGSASANLIINNAEFLSETLDFSILNEPLDTISYHPSLLIIQNFPVNDINNKGLYIKTTGSSLADGNGDLEIFISYDVFNS